MVLWPNGGKFSEDGMTFERRIRKNTKNRKCNFISLKEISRLNLNNQCHQLPEIKLSSKEELMDEFSKIESSKSDFYEKMVFSNYSKKEENKREFELPKLETVLGRINFEEKTLKELLSMGGEEVSNVPSERTLRSNGNLRVSRIFNPSVSIEELLGINRNSNSDFTSWVRQFVKEGDMNEGEFNTGDMNEEEFNTGDMNEREFNTPEKKRKIPTNLNNERIRKKCKRKIFD